MITGACRSMMAATKPWSCCWRRPPARQQQQMSPLVHEVAQRGANRAVCVVTDIGPGAAMTIDSCGWLPLHVGARFINADAVRLLLAAAPQAAMTAEDVGGTLPLHHGVIFRGVTKSQCCGRDRAAAAGGSPTGRHGSRQQWHATTALRPGEPWRRHRRGCSAAAAGRGDRKSVV